MLRSPPLARGGALTLFVCVGLAFLFYAPALGNAFFAEDALFLNEARRTIADPSLLFETHHSAYVRPTWIVYVALQYVAFGLAPFWYFATGVALHGVTAFLLWHLARRAALGAAAAWTAAIAFLGCYAGSEAMLWMAAHNTILSIALSLGAMLLHIRAVETGSRAALLGAIAVFFLCVFSRDTSLVLLAWVPAAQCFTLGFASLRKPRAWFLFAPLAASIALYSWMNPAIVTFFQGAGGEGGEAPRLSLTYLTAERLLGSFAWLWSPVPRNYTQLSLAAGAGAIVAFTLLVFVARPRPWRAAALGLVLALSSLASICISLRQAPCGTRVYYPACAGAALLTGAAAEALLSLRARSRAWSIAGFAAAAAFLAWLAVCGIVTFGINRDIYAKHSRGQTQLARAVARERAADTTILWRLVETPLGNVVHAQEFLVLFADVGHDQVTREILPREDWDRWVSAAGRDKDKVYGWSLERGLFETKTLPSGELIRYESYVPEAARGIADPNITIITIAPR